MEHEVFVPVPAEALRAVLCDPLRVARAVPGFQRDASGDGGRLKVRVAGHAITYRGTVTVTPAPDGTFAVTGDGTEARGTGTVTFSLTARVAATNGGSALTFIGTASGDGRIAELPPKAVESAAHRLLNRFAGNLGAAGQEPGSDPDDMKEPEESEEPEEPEEPEESEESEESGETRETDEARGTSETGGDDTGTSPEPVDEPDAGPDDEPDARSEPHLSVFDTEVPPPSLAPASDDEGAADDHTEYGDHTEYAEPYPYDTDELPPEPAAAHARRTMIGRSAEEVDHAPPRGRYAPTPAPDGGPSGATLRWVAPAAALALASAVVVGRALRRRR
ncbi:SRPBCC domain-containing protein [Streptomyces beihaiensis]|uniref:SRPBCC domain-containing protein n=1 Tax=Streptomyces beihaiensis TaxID=2984495 RepID=A0ABT3TUQ1_9ACTN|nr:SRPBCC domain-containing protein [Streptomyces beihaiensis]MCX3060749.1 SRPBCC domain-containing protein [Streptomyces beihaiensis]